MLNQLNVEHINKTLDLLAVFPVIIQCANCISGNVITNSNCVSCGAPLGQVAEDKISKHKKDQYKQYGILDLSKTTAGSTSFNFDNIQSASAIVFDATKSYNERNFSKTPIYKKCNNCWAMINIRKNKTCAQCGISIEYGSK